MMRPALRGRPDRADDSAGRGLVFTEERERDCDRSEVQQAERVRLEGDKTCGER